MPDTASAIAADMIDEVGVVDAITFMVARIARCSSVAEFGRDLVLLAAVAWRVVSIARTWRAGSPARGGWAISERNPGFLVQMTDALLLTFD